jgi:3-methyladenine DNA glycosylase Tag
MTFIGGIGWSIVKNSRRVEKINKFNEYRSVLEYHMEKAYDIIHKEHILTYSLDAFRVDDKDYDNISKEFVKLVSKFIGPSLLKEFVHLYGNIDTYTFNVLEYFGTRYENDEIRNTALEQITEAEVDEQV